MVTMCSILILKTKKVMKCQMHGRHMYLYFSSLRNRSKYTMNQKKFQPLCIVMLPTDIAAACCGATVRALSSDMMDDTWAMQIKVAVNVRMETLFRMLTVGAPGVSYMLTLVGKQMPDGSPNSIIIGPPFFVGISIPRFILLHSLGS